MGKGLLILVLSLLFIGCSRESKKEVGDYFQSNGKVKVVSTTAMIDHLVAEIGGERIDHLSLIVGDLDPHTYELVKGDGELLDYADLIFCNGLSLEHGASLRYYLENHRAIPLGDQLIKEHPESFLTVQGQVDPHFWMDVGLFAQAVDPIVVALCEKAPSYAEEFIENGAKLKAALIRADEEFYAKMQEVPPSRRFLVTSHDAFNYFTRRYLAEQNEEGWEVRCAAPEGLAPDGQMSVIDIHRVSTFLCHHRVPIVFPETNVSTDSLKKIISICREKGLDVKICEIPLYGDTMGGEGTGADNYLSMIQHNINVLHSCLSESDDHEAQCR